MGDHSPLSSFHGDIGIPINFREESGLDPFRNTELCGSLEVSSDERPPVQMRSDIGFSLGTAQNIHRSLFIFFEEIRACLQATARKSDFLSIQGISVSTAREAANSGSLSLTYC